MDIYTQKIIITTALNVLVQKAPEFVERTFGIDFFDFVSNIYITPDMLPDHLIETGMALILSVATSPVFWGLIAAALIGIGIYLYISEAKQVEVKTEEQVCMN